MIHESPFDGTHAHQEEKPKKTAQLRCEGVAKSPGVIEALDAEQEICKKGHGILYLEAHELDKSSFDHGGREWNACKFEQ